MRLKQGINGGMVAVAAVFAIVLGVLWAVPAKAADKGGSGKIAAADQDFLPALPKISGVYVGLNAGGQWSAGRLDYQDPPWLNSAAIDGLAGNGKVYGVHGGLDWRFSGTPFVLRLLASHQWGESEFNVSVNSMLGSGDILTATVEPTWKAGAGIGYVFKGGQMIYVGYQHARGDLRITSDLAPGESIDRSLQGHNFLAGIEIPVTEFVSFALQYDMTRYDGQNLLPAAWAPQRLDLDIDVHAVTGRLNIKLPAFN